MYPRHCAFAEFAIESIALPIHENDLQSIAMVRGSKDASASVTFCLLKTSAGFSLPGT